MNWQQDEPKVIDEEMLQQAIEEQGPQGQAGDIAKKEGIQYEDVLQLRLDYRNILKIYHLWHFTTITKLQLDNNVIERIEGLENLTNLIWLDLSFNNIEVIEGLDSLVKLQDLSLFNNRISVIENLDTLQNLHILSLGNNAVAQLENVLYLRKFKNLRTLNLAGNPICDEEKYKIFVTAYLPDLVYLDYRLLDEQMRETANTEYQYAIEEMQQNELQNEQAMEAQKINNEELQLHKDAFVEFLNGPQLFDSMFADDPDAENLALLPGIEALLESFKSKMEALCVQIFDFGLTQHAQRTAEVESFFTCSREAVTDNQHKAAQIAAEFESSRRQKIAEMQQITDAELLEADISSCQEQANQLSETLMSLELQLVDQLEEIIKDFERNVSDMVGGFIEYVQGIFAQCRDLENQHHEQQLEIALATLEKVVKNELEEEIPEDVAMLLVDKDTVTNAVSASHDTHLLKIDNREDELLTRINSWMSGLLKSIHDEEVTRNRKRISEIENYISYVTDELEDMRLSEDN
ncbi:dynein regulatory complex subunit 3 [Labeo rohita]|uniref:dynein regulatory complex subunit 3 n=1 Tax=Labeo rohita TaxID=84645 RepID=UPI0021E2B31E|nr:dynein regulatory complex subunit 3 [Labeo rohita]